MGVYCGETTSLEGVRLGWGVTDKSADARGSFIVDGYSLMGLMGLIDWDGWV